MQAEKWKEVQRELWTLIKIVNSVHRTVYEAKEAAQQSHVEVVGGLWVLVAFAASWTAACFLGKRVSF